MVLSLLIYSVAQFEMRKALEEHAETVPDQKKLKSLNQSVVADLKVFPILSATRLWQYQPFHTPKKF